MDSRITITKDKDGNLDIWLNEAGRDRLVRALQMLNESDDHIHLGPPDDEMAELPLQTVAYREGDDVLMYGKIIFRTDAGDAKHYSHVLGVENAPSEP